MVYLDYSATTKPSKEVIDRFTYIGNNFFANPNSMHEIGILAKKEIDKAIEDICNAFKIKTNEIIFTSGASESNNTVLKGLNVNHIISTKLEHSSIETPLGYLQTKGVKVDFVDLDENGMVNIESLKNLIGKEETLVSIGAVNSEVGIRQPIEEIGKVLKKYPNVTFHSDMTQIVGKDNFDITDVDLASFSCHKIFGFKGIGGLIKKEHVRLIPLIHGGKSTSIYRSGTPQTELICSTGTAVVEAFNDLDNKIEKIKELNKYLYDSIKDMVIINSNDYCIPQILNFSLKGINSDKALKYFSDHDIYLSTKTACSSGNYSYVINELYHDMERAENSLRVSISYMTTKDELDEFVKVLKEFINENS